MTPWIEWHGWTTGPTFGWLQQLWRAGSRVHVGDITEGERTYPTAAAAALALQRAVAKQLEAGFVYEDAPPPPPPPPPKLSKPPKGKAKAPRWMAKVDKRELAQVRATIERAGLAHRRADLESLLRPAIRLTLKTVKRPVAGVVTRFGGDPDLPPGLAWPTHGKTPLAFLAQFRLDELAKLDLERKLPRRGVLAVFAHLAHTDGYGEHAVAYHFPDVDALVRTAPPRAAEVDGRPGKVALATARQILTLPPPDHPAARALKLGDDADRYHDEVWLATSHGRDDPSEPGAHQLLGWPDAMTSAAFNARWELLAQIDSDDRFDFELGDVETLRVHIATTKLAAADFRTVKGSTQAE
ncbi:MAG: YwqG family protein [Proteobacteria bacterium]|nr:YwqG family protein [Pseudomonadota bacterium]